jgi:hypothetical protein
MQIRAQQLTGAGLRPLVDSLLYRVCSQREVPGQATVSQIKLRYRKER